VLHVDDLVEPRPEQIAFTRHLVLLRPHRSHRCGNRIIIRPKRESRNEFARFPALKLQNLAISNPSQIQKSTRNQSLKGSSPTTS
jgi:hypothetical protein